MDFVKGYWSDLVFLQFIPIVGGEYGVKLDRTSDVALKITWA